jgi:hypothetical protein
MVYDKVGKLDYSTPIVEDNSNKRHGRKYLERQDDHDPNGRLHR